MFDLVLFYFLVEVAPVAARDDELVDFQLRMNALCSIKQVGVKRILCSEPDAGETVSILPLYSPKALLQFRLTMSQDVSQLNILSIGNIKVHTEFAGGDSSGSTRAWKILL